MNPNPNPFSLFTLLTVLLLAPMAALHAAEPVTAQARWENSELIYEQPAASPDAGQPIGNGRMGTMVWTSPEVIHLQINRVDVFAVNRDHSGNQFSATDYCGGIAGVVVHVGGQPFAPGGKSFRQRLSLDNAECVIEGDGLQVQCFVAADADVLVMEVDDRRASPEPLKVVSVEIESRLGEDCRLRNPWDRPCIVQEVGGPTQIINSPVVRIVTTSGSRYCIHPAE